MFYIDIAFNSLLVLFIGLILVFLLLLGYTFWNRIKRNYWNRYQSKFRDYFFPMLFSFVEEDRTQAEADELIAKLTKRTQDIVFFLQMLREMAELLKGAERERLGLLIEHELFWKFYEKKLFSYFKNDQLLALVYFEKGGAINDKIATRLITLSKSANTKIAFGATKALQSSNDLTIRKNALVRFLKRKDASELMIGEILYLFNRDDVQEHKKVGEALREILLKDDITPAKKKIIVLYIGYQNFYEYGDFLLRYFEKISYSSQKLPLIEGLITALGALDVVESAPVIRKYLKVNDTELQLTCVETLSRLGGESNFVFLTNLLLDLEFEVRKAIIKNLVKDTELGLRLLNRFLVSKMQFVARFRSESNPPDELKEVVKKIRNTALGIKIMLRKKRRSLHV